MPNYSATTTATNIINRVAAEVGLIPVTDPYDDATAGFVTLTHLLNTAGEELSFMFDWEVLRAEHEITTTAIEDGDFDLPVDFLRILNETAWDRTNNVPMFGPLSVQEWSALLGRDFNSNTIYVSWRLAGDQLIIFPREPVGQVYDLFFEYIRNTWVLDEGGSTFKKQIETGADTPLFNETLIARYLKVKFLTSKGLDATSAQDDFNEIMSILMGQNKGGRTLNAGRGGRAFPYVNPMRNVPDTNFGT